MTEPKDVERVMNKVDGLRVFSATTEFLINEITAYQLRAEKAESQLSAYREALREVLDDCIPHVEATISWMHTTVIDYGDSPYYKDSLELLEKIKCEDLTGDTKQE